MSPTSRGPARLLLPKHLPGENPPWRAALTRSKPCELIKKILAAGQARAGIGSAGMSRRKKRRRMRTRGAPAAYPGPLAPRCSPEAEWGPARSARPAVGGSGRLWPLLAPSPALRSPPLPSPHAGSLPSRHVPAPPALRSRRAPPSTSRLLSCSVPGTLPSSPAARSPPPASLTPFASPPPISLFC